MSKLTRQRKRYQIPPELAVVPSWELESAFAIGVCRMCERRAGSEETGRWNGPQLFGVLVSVAPP